MKRKINFWKLLDLVFWSLIIIGTCIELYNGILVELDVSQLKNINFQEFTFKEYMQSILGLLFLILFFGISNMFKMFHFVVIYIGIKIARRKYKKEKVDKIDLVNDNYYREILPKYSPAVLSYLDDFNIDIEDVIATLLMLELKGKIKIKDKIILMNDNYDNLDENEKYILNIIKDNDLKEINLYEYSRIVKNDAKRLGLLQEKRNVKNKIKKKLIVSGIIYLLLLIIFNIFPILLGKHIFLSDSGLLFMCCGFVILFAFIAFMPYSIIVSIVHYKNLNSVDPYVRSETGKNINLKLEGLRKYLLDFSNIEDKSNEELKIWEEYLIYSVILGINTKVVEDIRDKIK